MSSNLSACPEQRNLTGASYRQLDYWTRRGFLRLAEPTPGSGYARTWPEGELEVARRMVIYIQAGLTVPAAHHAARHGGQLPGGTWAIRRAA